MFRKFNKRGVAMTEYAILLAFIAAVAVAFTSDGGLASSIKNAIAMADNAIAQAGKKAPVNLLDNVELAKKGWNYTNGSFTENTNVSSRLHTAKIDIEGNTNYKIEIDLNQMNGLLKDDYPFLQVGFFSAQEGYDNKIDSGWIDLTNPTNTNNNNYTLALDGTKATITFKSGDNHDKFAMNFRAVRDSTITKYDKGNEDQQFSDIPNIQDSLRSAITLTKEEK